ncbi:cytochrome P450 2K1-like isoform X1 [Hoplias malabaricus]|uniref:cytochrome P450 2K1-like isoform X1 n=1 Tax=Hoplias malabaricus TaxID=27720 RepID=UPI0034621E81
MAVVEELLPVTSRSALLGILLMLLSVLYFFSSRSRSQKKEKEPPGPKPLPILGNLLHLDLKRPHLSLLSMSKQYGSVFTVHLGPRKVVVLSGYETIKQALVNRAEEFENRDLNPLFTEYNQGYGILFSNGKNWKTMRRFTLSTLRDLGMGKKGSEEKIIEETCYLREVFEQFKGKPFRTSEPVSYAVSNVISAIVYGSRFEYTDPVFIDMVTQAKENIRLVGSASIQLYNMFPWLCSWVKNRKRIMINREQFVKEVTRLAGKLQETVNPQDCRGLVDYFFVRQQKEEESGDRNHLFHKNNLIYTVTNLFAAGTDTTAATLCWAFLLMAKYPHVQDQVQKEIDRVIGGRQARMEDRKDLPYTNAVIHEIQRIANIVPMSLPHTTTCDVHFQGYFIKKGTCVIPLLTSVLRDENEWKSPNTFNPEHFLDDKGQFVKRESFLPFSAGHRVCVGESLAKMELFLFFTSILQHFSFTPPPGVSEEQLDLTPAVGLTLSPCPHEMCAVVRNA